MTAAMNPNMSGSGMILPTDTIVAVADGEKLSLFRNTGTETLSLAVAPEENVGCQRQRRTE
jgi:protein required for attachment to host cells